MTVDRQIGGRHEARVRIEAYSGRSGLRWVWLLFLMFLPFLTAPVYLVTRGSGMADRAAIQSVAAREATEDYIRGVAGGATREISHAKQLLDSGAITAAEFDQLKNAAPAKAT